MNRSYETFDNEKNKFIKVDYEINNQLSEKTKHLPSNKTLNEELSENILQTATNWVEDGFIRKPISYLNETTSLGCYIKYITVSNKARIGGILISIDDKVGYFVLKNVSNGVSWSVQFDNTKAIFVGTREDFDKKKRREKKKQEQLHFEILDSKYFGVIVPPINDIYPEVREHKITKKTISLWKKNMK